MKLLLHIQFIRKHFIDREFEDSITLNDFMKELCKDGITQKDLDYTIMIDDVEVKNNRKSTLKECNIANGEHLNIVESQYLKEAIPGMSINLLVYDPQKTLEQNRSPDNKDKVIIKLDNLSSFQTIRSVAKLAGERLNIPVNEIRLIFAGKQLDPYRSLSNSCIQRDTTLYLVRRVTQEQQHQ